MLAHITPCMIKIFWRGRGGDTFKAPPLINNVRLYPRHVLQRCFWKDHLMTPANSLQASFTAIPSPSTTPTPNKIFDHTFPQIPLNSCHMTINAHRC